MLKKIILALVILTVLAVAGVVAVQMTMPGWYARIWYPLDHADLINRSASQNHLDPALVAAVIFEESGFEDGSRSTAGAVGLMQLMPATATWIAAKTDGAGFVIADLKNPDINIAYGCWYLGYLMERYGNAEVALAAYNGGTENVDRWLADAKKENRPFSSVTDIPWQETREYVARVDHTREVYVDAYSSELGT